MQPSLQQRSLRHTSNYLDFRAHFAIVQLFFRNAATPGHIYYTDNVCLLNTVPKNSLIATAWLQPNSIDELDTINFHSFR